jgi:ATP-dependent Clp protease ATP-binding subunit ClpC
VLERLADVGYVPEFGARELKRKIQTEIETPLAREILSGKAAKGDTLQVDFDKSSSKMTFIKR